MTPSRFVLRTTLAFAAAVLTLGPAAHAAPPPGEPAPEGPGGPGRGPGAGRLFISPAGEPFRDEDGRAAWFAGADTDHDGVLTLAEFRADAMRFFKRLDADADGLVGGQENQVYEKTIAPEITRMSFDAQGPGGGRPMRGGGEGGPPGGAKRSGKAVIGREGAARFSMLNEPQPVRGADLNLDYRVTADEWARTAAKRFTILDKDGDGQLTLATLPRAPDGPPGGKAPRDRADRSGPPPR